MELLIGIVLGYLLTTIFTQKPLKFEVKHITEPTNPPISAEELEKLEQAMLKEDATKDELYKNLDETIVEVNNVMGGSDRV